MSHAIRAHTKVTNKNYLLSALDKLGWKYLETSTTTIKLGDAMTLSQQKDGTWQVTGDPYYDKSGLKKYYNRTSNLIADLQTYYNHTMVMNQLSQMGFYIENEEENNEEIVLTFENGL